MYQKRYSPEQALNRIKLMMGYDLNKTLNENAESTGLIMSEQTAGEVSSIAKSIWKSMAGDVETEDLEKVQQILNTQVFGKKFKDDCMLAKVMQYYKGHQGMPTWALSTTWSTEGLMGDINGSSEMFEPEFADIKQELVDSINKELNGFCKTGKGGSSGGSGGGGGKRTTGGGTGTGFRECQSKYTQGCKSNVIQKVQSCLGITADGKYGPKTQAALSAKGFSSFTDADVDKICGKTTPNPTPSPEVSGEITTVNMGDVNF